MILWFYEKEDLPCCFCLTVRCVQEDQRMPWQRQTSWLWCSSEHGLSLRRLLAVAVTDSEPLPRPLPTFCSSNLLTHSSSNDIISFLPTALCQQSSVISLLVLIGVVLILRGPCHKLDPILIFFFLPEMGGSCARRAINT